MSYKIPKHQLPKWLQLYAEGTSDLPEGSFTKLEIKSAVKYRQTFFRQLQRHKPGLQYQWADYQALMWTEIVSYTKRVLRDEVMKMWDQLTGHNSRLGSIFRSEMRRRLRNCDNISLTKRAKLVKEMMEHSLMIAIRDPRTLGILEEAVVGKAFYGIPSRPNFIDWSR